MKYVVFLIALLFSITPSFAGDYKIDYQKSYIKFSGKHAGNIFSGTFKEWTGEIQFSSNNLGSSILKATINTASAKTGNTIYDGTLLQLDWFNVKKYPEALFLSKSITKDGNGNYKAEGILKIRDVTKPVAFVFTLSDLSRSTVTAKSRFVVDRLSFGLGSKSDPKAGWVSKAIELNLKIVATKDPN